MTKRTCRRCQQLRIVAIFFVLSMIMILTMIGKTQADVYKYTDENGKKVYVGSMSQIPERYRDQFKTQVPTDEVSNTSSTPISKSGSSSGLLKRSEIRRVERYLKMLETDVIVKNKQVLVPVTVTYHGKEARVTMLMDTGASGTVFYRDALERLDPASQAAGYARVAGGGVVKISSIEFDRIKVGPFQAKGIRSFVMKNKAPGGSFDGLLGMDFLMNVKYELDLKREVIIWNPEKYKVIQAELEALKASPNP